MPSRVLSVRESEAKLLWGCILSPLKIFQVRDAISERDFESAGHAVLWRVLCKLDDRGTPIDQDSALQFLAEEMLGDVQKAASILAGCEGSVISGAHTGENLGNVARAAMMRRLEAACSETADELGQVTPMNESGVERLVREATERLFDIQAEGDILKRSEPDPDPMLGLLQKVLAKEVDEERDPMATGIYDFDDRTNGGLRPGQLCVFAARTSTGKTTMLEEISVRMSRDGRHVLYVSFETGVVSLQERMLANAAGVDLHRLQTRRFDEDEADRLIALERELTGSVAFHFIPDRTLGAARNVIRRRMASAQVDVIAIDYLQKVARGSSASDANREQQVAAVSSGLASLAVELSVPVVTAAQLGRSFEGETGDPQLRHIRESGAIEQDADIVVAMWRDKKDEDSSGMIETQMKFLKNRDGEVGYTFKMYLDAPKVRFQDAAPIIGEPINTTTPIEHGPRTHWTDR